MDAAGTGSSIATGATTLAWRWVTAARSRSRFRAMISAESTIPVSVLCMNFAPSAHMYSRMTSATSTERCSLEATSEMASLSRSEASMTPALSSAALSSSSPISSKNESEPIDFNDRMNLDEVSGNSSRRSRLTAASAVALSLSWTKEAREICTSPCMI